MSIYPTENSLTMNATHGMLNSMKWPDKVAATSPTRREEKGVGYDVQLSFAMRIQFQYKRPQYIHSKRGMAFDINGDQVGTLCFRDEDSVSYLACPRVENRAQLHKSLDNCWFINVHSVSSRTSKLYIPKHYGKHGHRKVTAKIKNGKYYHIPDWAIVDWEKIRDGIETRSYGLTIRQNGSKTSQYQRFVSRLQNFDDLYEFALPDGGEEPSNEEKILNEEAAQRLVSHAMEQYNMYHQETDQQLPPTELEREALWAVIENMRESRNPAVHRISRSRELICEEGSSIKPLQLGRLK